MKDQAILANLIEAKMQKNPDLDVLTFVNINPAGDFEDEIRSYRQLWEQGQRINQALLERDMEKGSSFALVMQNHPEFIDAMVGSSLAGTVFVPIDPHTGGDPLPDREPRHRWYKSPTHRHFAARCDPPDSASLHPYCQSGSDHPLRQ